MYIRQILAYEKPMGGFTAVFKRNLDTIYIIVLNFLLSRMVIMDNINALSQIES